MGEAAVADRTDDTDDISLRISGSKPPQAQPRDVAPAVQVVSPAAFGRAINILNNKTPPGSEMARKVAKGKAAGRAKYAPPLGRRPMIEWIPPAELTIDDAYQRTTENQASQALIKRIAANFDWRLCTPLIVSRRADGRFVVIDG